MKRDPTHDLAVGIGLFRWGDTRKDVQTHLPKAKWTVYEPMYATQKVFYVEKLVDLDGATLSGAIDVGEKDSKQVVVLYLDPERAIELASRLGKPASVAPTNGVATWSAGEAQIELSAFPDEASLWIQRPKAKK